MQRAGVVAIEKGEDFVAFAGRAHSQEPRHRLRYSGAHRPLPLRRAAGRVLSVLLVDGETDTRKLVFRLIDEAQVGLAPGTSFGPGGENFVRVCYARDPNQVADAMTRVADVLTS